MAHLLHEGAFNINRGGYEGAYEVAERVLDTRDLLAKLFHAKSSRQVIFTPGVTWSLRTSLPRRSCSSLRTGAQRSDASPFSSL